MAIEWPLDKSNRSRRRTLPWSADQPPFGRGLSLLECWKTSRNWTPLLFSFPFFSFLSIFPFPFFPSIFFILSLFLFIFSSLLPFLFLFSLLPPTNYFGLGVQHPSQTTLTHGNPMPCVLHALLVTTTNFMHDKSMTLGFPCAKFPLIWCHVSPCDSSMFLEIHEIPTISEFNEIRLCT